MAQLSVKCSCNDVFKVTIDDARLEEAFQRTSLAPLVLPHKDHYITVYVDKHHAVRGVEPVIVIREQEKASIDDLIDEIQKEADPFENFDRFIKSLIPRVESPEMLFAAGEIVGKRMWLDMRSVELLGGAKYATTNDLVIKEEIQPILDKAGNAVLMGNDGIEVTDCASPQFVAGLAQGVLDAVTTSKKVEAIARIVIQRMKFAHQIFEDSVIFTVFSYSHEHYSG